MQWNHFITTSRPDRLLFLQACSKHAHHGGLWERGSASLGQLEGCCMPGPGGQQKGCPRKAEMTDGLNAQRALECSFILSHCALPAPSPPPPIPLIPCLPSFMPIDLLFFLALISLPHNQPPPCFLFCPPQEPGALPTWGKHSIIMMGSVRCTR